jgi:hypothetical protein
MNHVERSISSSSLNASLLVSNFEEIACVYFIFRRVCHPPIFDKELEKSFT